MLDNLAKLDCDLDQNPTVIVREIQKEAKLGRNRGIPNPSWNLVETNISCDSFYVVLKKQT